MRFPHPADHLIVELVGTGEEEGPFNDGALGRDVTGDCICRATTCDRTEFDEFRAHLPGLQSSRDICAVWSGDDAEVDRQAKPSDGDGGCGDVEMCEGGGDDTPIPKHSAATERSGRDRSRTRSDVYKP